MSENLDCVLKLGNNYTYNPKRIGHGAYSDVYIGIKTSTNQTVAIKRIDLGKCDKKFMNEVYIMKNLDHSNIVKLYDNFILGNYLFLVLEYCKTGCLAKLKKPIPEPLAKKYFKEIINALLYMKKQGIVHRDIKPANILLDASDHIKITDFGLATNSPNLMETICGSRLYMAPEIMNVEKYTDKADMWSIGLVLYELVHGYHPYGVPENEFILLKLIKEKPILYGDTISTEIKLLLSSLLQKDPKLRSSLYELSIHEWISEDSDLGISEYGSLSDGVIFSLDSSRGSNKSDSYFHDDESYPLELDENDENCEIIVRSFLSSGMGRSEPINLRGYLKNDYNPFPNSPIITSPTSKSLGRTSSGLGEYISTSYDILSGSIKRLQNS